MYRHLALFGAFSILGAVLVWPIFGADYPPGVDTATFLHLSWVTKLAASGQLANPFQDPYWYGGFPYLVSYPPLGYGLVGVISFVTRLDLIGVYLFLLVLAYGGIGAATYWLGLEFGLRKWAAALAGIMALLAYPVLTSIFVWGWFSSVVALPVALVGFMLLERSLRRGEWRLAAWGGFCLALTILIHHMTGLSLGLGMIGWFVFHVASGVYARRQVVITCGIFVAVAVLVVLPWGIPFLIHTLDVGFQREVPGLWRPDLAVYGDNIMDSSLIGDFVYPSYLGITLLVLAIAGTVYALMERRRLAGLAVILLVLVWFSMGANVNPLVRVYPFSALDIARFHLYMVPLMALLGAVLVERVFDFLRDLWPLPSVRVRLEQTPILRYGFAITALSLVLLLPSIDAWKARDFMAPYQVEASVDEAMNWLAKSAPSPDGPDPIEDRIYSVGLWNWDAFLIPYLANRQLIDGWHDEGASNVRQIRQLRLMGWTGDVDIQKAHRLLTELGAGYVLVNRISNDFLESSNIFWDEMEASPEFDRVERWGDVAVFRVLPLPDQPG